MRASSADSVLSLAPDEVHLWLSFYDEIVDDRLLRTYREILSESERQQHTRFHFAHDRQRYLVTRALVRTVLSRYAPVRPEEWLFSVNGYGRPAIHDTQQGVARLSFNISHTRGLIVLGVTRQRELGVDVENILVREVSMDVAENFFAPEEAAELSAISADRKVERFFEYWTFKESYIKARGMGLSIPLDKFAFRYSRGRGVELAVDLDLGDDPARWHFWQLRPLPQYLIAVCAERTDRRAPKLAVRKVIPTVSEEVLPAAFSRVSHALTVEELD